MTGVQTCALPILKVKNIYQIPWKTQFLDEFLPKVVCSNANCEVVDKSGNVKGYLTQKELSKALTKEHMADAAKSN